MAWRLGSIPLAKRLLRCAQMLSARVGRLDLDLVEPRHRPQLVVARLGQKRRLGSFEPRAHHWMRAELGDLAHHLDDEGLGEGGPVHEDGVPLPHLEGVAAQEIGQRGDSGVAHRSRMLPAAHRAESTASRIRPAPKRTGSSATRPVSRSVRAIASLAASASIRFVFSATATTGAGRTCRAIRT